VPLSPDKSSVLSYEKTFQLITNVTTNLTPLTGIAVPYLPFVLKPLDTFQNQGFHL